MADAVRTPLPKAAQRFFVFLAIQLAADVATPIVLRAFRWASEIEALVRVQAVVGLVLAVGQIAVVVGLRRAAGNHAARGLLGFVVGVRGLDLIATALQTAGWFDLPDPLRTSNETLQLVETAFFVLAYLAGDVALWVALERLLGAALRSWMRPAFYAARALQLIDGALLLFAVDRLVARHDATLEIVAWARTGLTILATVPVLAALRLLARGEGAEGGGAPVAETEAEAAKRDLTVGAAWLAGAIVVTIASYAIASTGAGGGRVLIATGAFAYGLVRIGRGLTRR